MVSWPQYHHWTGLLCRALVHLWLSSEQTIAWVCTGQLMHLVSMLTQPPKYAAEAHRSAKRLALMPLPGHCAMHGM